MKVRSLSQTINSLRRRGMYWEDAPAPLDVCDGSICEYGCADTPMAKRRAELAGTAKRKGKPEYHYPRSESERDRSR